MKYAAIALLLLISGTACSAQAVSSAWACVTVMGNTATPYAKGATIFDANGKACTTNFVNATELQGQCPVPLAAPFTVVPPCASVPLNVWTFLPIAPPAGNFEISFDYTPATAKQDGVIGFAATSASTYNVYAGTVLFTDTGVIQARNGQSYAAAASIPYTIGTTYHITMDVNVATATYNIYVGTTTRQTIGANYAFRPGAPATAFAFLTAIVDEGAAGTNTICNVAIAPYPTATVAGQMNVPSVYWVAPNGERTAIVQMN